MEWTVPGGSSLRIKVFADGADLEGILELAANPIVCGFTTNPTLMRKAGIEDYEGFAEGSRSRHGPTHLIRSLRG